jgi:hypothetical protein
MKIVTIVVLFLAFMFLFPLLVMWLISAVFSDSFVTLVFGGSPSYWQTVGLMWLCAILCKSTPSFSSKE